MVLHHQHDDVPYLQQQIGAHGQVGSGERPRCRGRAAGQASHLAPFEQMPHVPATLESAAPDLYLAETRRNVLISERGRYVTSAALAGLVTSRPVMVEVMLLGRCTRAGGQV